jgi:hypothetical protein
VVAFGAVIKKIARSALATKTIVHSNRFQQCGLSRAIFTRKETDPGSQFEFFKPSDNWNAERVSMPQLYRLDFT